MLAVFENHDTRPTGYAAVPVLNGGIIQQAGPTYGGFNSSNFSTFNPNPGAQAILTADGTLDNNVLRVSSVVAAPGGPQGIYQPHTSPPVELRLTVGESPLTGMVPDFALANPISGTPGLFSGLLPGIDRFPLSEILSPLTSVATDRAASALSPTAYRGADGGMNVYFVRSEAPAATPNARGFKLYHARMAWNAALGTWQASAPGVAVNDPTVAAAGWFSAPVEISTAPGQQSNHSPFALHVDRAAASATLFWVSSVPTAGGGVTDNLVYASLAADGTPAAFAPVAVNLDPNLRRYGVRAAFDSPSATTVSLYYGGVTGRWGLYYIPRAANATGTPVAPVPDAATDRRVERSLEIPSAIQSASEPSAIFRRLAAVGGGATPVLDVYYTGILRSTGTPDLMMTRFRMDGAGRNARLTPLTLPLIVNERLEQVGRELNWNADHIAWNRSTAPTITIQYGFRTGGPVVTTNPANWRWDNASQTLFQNIDRPGGVLQVLVDTGAGTVRFRGAGVPVRTTDQVLATYQPQTYRLTPDGAADTGAIAFGDPTLLAQTQDGTSFNQVLRRPLGDIPAGRSWLLWRKESADKQASALYSSVRRVGIDLKALGALGQDETLALGPRTANFNSPLATTVVNVAGVGPVPFDADVKTGKIFVDPVYEGLGASVTTTKHTATGSAFVAVNGTLEMIEEQAPIGQNKVGSSTLSLAQTVNEGQVFGFVDHFVPTPTTDITGFRVADRAQDPTLQPGRVWMFWASPRARTGRVPVGPNRLDALPRGYDLFWQSLAPRFETSTP
jgi:hypothetical protein